MFRSLFSSSLVVLALAAAGCATQEGGEQAGDEHAGDAEMASATYEGVLVDMKCYSMMPAENAGNDHQTPDGTMPNCGSACAAMGIPVGLLSDGEPGGQVYLLVSPTGPLADHIAKWARVSGDAALEGNAVIPSKIEVRGEDGSYSEVEIATMM